jgi:DNA repair protein RadA/Sms
MNLGLERTEFVKASDVQIPDVFYRRIKSNVEELDRIFGEGLLPGSSITITARAGLGKTTFLLQLLESLSKAGYTVAHASGEESLHQLAYNCKRLNVQNVRIANETDVDKLLKAIEDNDVLVIDSFQALEKDEDMNTREHETFAINSLVKHAKDHECVVIFVMHLTKAGTLKGNSLIPHICDVNMQITLDEDTEDSSARVISVYKNRFGSCNDFNSFMTESGFLFSGPKETEEIPLNKKKRQDANITKILAMKNEPFISKGRVIKELGLTPSQAYIILKDMQDMGLIEKYGRGVDAVFHVVKTDE